MATTSQTATSQIWLIATANDELRAAQLQTALTEDDVPVTLDGPGTVVLCWSRHVAAGERAAEIRESDVASPMAIVLFDSTNVPPQWANVPSFNLAKWRGSRSNPEYLRLLTLLHARPATAWHQWLKYLAARKKRVSALLAPVGMAIAFSADVMGVQGGVCALPINQPAWSDGCGYLGLGGKPTAEERIAWESREPRSCMALREHIGRFPEGAYRAAASDLLATSRFVPAEDPLEVAEDRKDYLRQSVSGFSSRIQAERDALKRAQSQASDSTCAPVDDSERLLSASVIKWQALCNGTASGTVCALEFWARCRISRMRFQEQCG